MNMLSSTQHIAMNGWSVILLVMQFVPACTLVPRFILNLRAVYARDLQGRCGGGIDTAFGFTELVSGRGAASADMLMGAGRNERLEPVEEIHMEETRTTSSGA